MVIATPGTGNIQPRINGALPTFHKAGLTTATSSPVAPSSRPRSPRCKRGGKATRT